MFVPVIIAFDILYLLWVLPSYSGLTPEQTIVEREANKASSLGPWKQSMPWPSTSGREAKPWIPGPHIHWSAQNTDHGHLDVGHIWVFLVVVWKEIYGVELFYISMTMIGRSCPSVTDFCLAHSVFTEVQGEVELLESSEGLVMPEIPWNSPLNPLDSHSVITLQAGSSSL